MILLDTCALLWWTLEPEKLSKPAKKACAKIYQEGAFISSVSIWEIGIKLKNGTIIFNDTLQGYMNRLNDLGSIEIIPIDEQLWVDNIMLEWDNRDPADRTIVATALRKNLPIVTKDNLIRSFYKNVIW